MLFLYKIPFYTVNCLTQGRSLLKLKIIGSDLNIFVYSDRFSPIYIFILFQGFVFQMVNTGPKGVNFCTNHRIQLKRLKYGYNNIFNIYFTLFGVKAPHIPNMPYIKFIFGIKYLCQIVSKSIYIWI